MIKAVIFDYGGVAIYVNEEATLVDMANTYGVDITTFRKHFEPIAARMEKGMISERTLWRLLSNSLNKPLPKNRFILFNRQFIKNLVFYPEIFALVKKLKQRRYKTAVLSNSCSANTRLIEERGGYDVFDEQIISFRVHLSKPDPKIFKLAAKKLGVSLSECLFIDDEEKNLIPAKRLGMKTLLAVSPKQVVKEVSRLLELTD